MLELEAALQRVLSVVQPLPGEAVPQSAAHGRFLSEDVSAVSDLPPFDNSAMDGFAVQSADLAHAAIGQPLELRLLGRVAAGEVFPGALSAGGCVRVFTGSPLPTDADAVVMQEDTRIDPARPEMVRFVEPVKPWENVRFRGEDVKRGTVVAEAGQRINAGTIALLAAAGVATLRVTRQPRIALIATGSELADAGSALDSGWIYESNRAMLSSLVSQAGGLPTIYPIVPDSLDATRDALAGALDEFDAVVSSGGVSVGDLDFVKSAFEQLDGELALWKVAIRPGKPFAFGRAHGKLFFGLPGNPVSAMVTFLLLVRPALLRLQGAAQLGLPTTPGILNEPLENRGDRRHFMRVIMSESGQVRSAGTQASHILRSLARANGLVDVPPQTAMPAKSQVQVMRWEA